MSIRTRFAPSPTGYLHIGGIRTALYSYALANSPQFAKEDGQFIVRIEDTDRKRYVPESVDEIFEVLELVGILPNESSKHGGEFGPYIQSERVDLYRRYAEELVRKDAAYYCFLSPEEAAEIRAACQTENRPFRSPHREMAESEVNERLARGESFVIRQKMPSGRILQFTDNVQGEMTFSTDDVDEGVLIKSDGFPTYHLAVVVDDHLMKITHAFRAFEWIPSTPKHILLYEAFGWELPEMYHLSTILDPRGGKLSKRKGAVAAKEFLAEGYLSEAILNFLMLLGWASPIEYEYRESEKELFTLEEFVELFDPKDLNKSNPIFNQDKLLWFNQQWLAKLSSGELAGRYLTWAEDFTDLSTDDMKNDPLFGKKIALVQTRVKLLSEITDMLQFFYHATKNIDWDIKQLKNVQDKLSILREDIKEFTASLPEDSNDWSHEEWEKGMREIGNRHDMKHGDVFMILRVAVVGSPFSPPLFESLQLLGKNEILSRL